MDTFKKLFINREISWLSFNHRVMQEAANPKNPLLERLRFLGIYANNLDEFFRVRVAFVQRLQNLKTDIQTLYPDQPEKILKEINKILTRHHKQFDSLFTNIVEELAIQKIRFIDEKAVTADQNKFIEDLYHNKLLNLINPIMASQVKGLLELKDSTAYLVAALGKEKNKQYALLELPVDEFSRYIELPSEDEDRTIIWLDDVIRICLPYIFAGFDQISSHLFSIKISRDAEMNFYNDIKDNVLERVHQGVIDRYKGLPVQLTYDKSMPLNMLKYLIANLGLTSSSLLFPAGRYLNFKDLMCFPINDRSDLMYEKWDIPGKTPFESSESIIKTVQQRDVYLHCPYHSFSYYIRMLRDASVDPDVQAIKTTVYRLASNSKIVKALINAARNGKKVTVVVELLARFDESSNINWAQKMEEAGIKVIFGVEGLKIHSKLTYIKHKEKDIVCIGTGNFHEGNAGIYTDVFLFTAHKGIAKEVSEVFKFINRPYGNLNFKYLWVSPYQMRKKIYYQIAKEVRNAKQGKLASILVKINHLTDYGVITRLYNAADKGVNIRLIVRGNCSIVSNKNIEVVSIVDRYLEHSRIFIFANGGEELCYISSADWMTRNLDHRIEVAAPIFDPQIHNDLKYIIECGLKDNVKARITDDTQKNKFKVRKKNEEPFQSQFELYKFHSGLRQLTENEWRTLSV